MLRGVLTYLSKSHRAERFIAGSPLTRRVVSRFIAGYELEDALKAVSELNAKGHEASLNHLGESVTSEEMARQVAEEYILTLEEIAKRGLRSHVSVKPTQLGIDLREEICYELLHRVLEKAEELGIFIRIDMENTPYTDKTLDLHWKLRDSFSNLGVAIQSYLRRSEEDIKKMMEKGGKVRLVKGAYLEPEDVAFPDKKDVDSNFVKLLEMMLNRSAFEKGCRVAVATHDEKLVDYAIEYAAKQGMNKSEFEFQMIYGIRRDLQEKLLQSGFSIRVYVPYGHSWYPYFMRRLAERPANLMFFLRHLI